jgi:hydroxymethylbilane synthase
VISEGDRHLDRYLNKIGGKGLFTKALEDTLLESRADIAVHSMKDVPNELAKGFKIGAICKREDACDVLVTRKAQQTIENLPAGSVVGTSSLRRQSQILALRPDFTVKMLRGNINTRIQKLKKGEFDAIILASAGLKRLQFNQLNTSELSKEKFIPCAGQGALGIEYLSKNQAILEKIKVLNDLKSFQCVEAERALSQRLGGNCQVPIGAYAFIENKELSLKAVVGKPDGSLLIKTQQKGISEDYKKIGLRAAEDLLAQGAEKILSALRF